MVGSPFESGRYAQNIISRRATLVRRTLLIALIIALIIVAYGYFAPDSFNHLLNWMTGHHRQ